MLVSEDDYDCVYCGFFIPSRSPRMAVVISSTPGFSMIEVPWVESDGKKKIQEISLGLQKDIAACISTARLLANIEAPAEHEKLGATSTILSAKFQLSRLELVVQNSENNEIKLVEANGLLKFIPPTQIKNYTKYSQICKVEAQWSLHPFLGTTDLTRDEWWNAFGAYLILEYGVSTIEQVKYATRLGTALYREKKYAKCAAQIAARKALNATPDELKKVATGPTRVP